MRFLTLDTWIKVACCRWIAEADIFRRLSQIRMFEKFRKQKTFSSWRQVISRQKFRKARQVSLSHCVPALVVRAEQGEIKHGWDQRHRDRRPSTTECPACWAMGTNKVKKCAVRKIIYFVLGWLEQPRQKSFVLAWRAQWTNHGRTLSHVLQESPFASVWKVRRGRPFLVSLD